MKLLVFMRFPAKKESSIRKVHTIHIFGRAGDCHIPLLYFYLSLCAKCSTLLTIFSSFAVNASHANDDLWCLWNRLISLLYFKWKATILLDHNFIHVCFQISIFLVAKKVVYYESSRVIRPHSDTYLF
jgi:hypothetical protein